MNTTIKLIMGVMILAAEATMCSGDFNRAWFGPNPHECFYNIPTAGSVLVTTGAGSAVWSTFTSSPNNGRVYERSVWYDSNTRTVANPNPRSGGYEMDILEAMNRSMQAELDHQMVGHLMHIPCDQATRKKEEIEQGSNATSWCTECGWGKYIGGKTYCENAKCERSPNYRNVTEIPNEPEEVSTKVGDTVWSAITGMGPYVVVNSTFHEIRIINGKSPNEGQLATINDANFEKALKLDDRTVEAWIVKDRCGRYFTVPTSEVTKTQPSRSIFLIVLAYIMYIVNLRKIWKSGI